MKKFSVGILGILLSAVSVGSCDSGDAAKAGVSSGAKGDIRAGEFCSLDGLDEVQRQTYVLIDGQVLKRTSNAKDFIEYNAGIRDAVLRIAESSMALESGTSFPREHISIYVLPKSGGAAKRAFSGCIPGFSKEELEDIKNKSSKLDDFLSGGNAQKLENSTKSYRTKLISSLSVAAMNADDGEPIKGNELSEASLMKSLSASGKLIETENGLPRVILITNTSLLSIPNGEEIKASRQEGFDIAGSINFDFGRAEIAVVQVNSGSMAGRDFFDAMFLAKNGNLFYWGDNQIGGTSEAPETIFRFLGEVEYPSGPEAIQIRLAADANGKLDNSWIVLRGAPDRSTPLTGQLVCDNETNCSVRSDDGGFAQAWSLAPGGDPEFDNDMPFGGLRDFEFEISDGKLTGKIFDPSVGQIGHNKDQNYMSLQAVIQDKATF